MGNMTVEQIYKDRKTFSTKVFEVASMDLHNMGISVISYTLKDVRDDVGYLASLGQARTAQVGRAPPGHDGHILPLLAVYYCSIARFTSKLILNAVLNMTSTMKGNALELQTILL